jgi:hypothetical protein
MAYEFNAFLSRLVGLRMFSVQFVLDYVQLRFDGAGSPDDPVLTCNVLPTVVTGERQITAAEPGWADALLALIGQDVSATHEATGVGLKLDFLTGSVRLHPTSDELVGPEIAMLGGFEDRHWMVWRPGEEAFEYL